MQYISTRGNNEAVSSAEAIKIGMVPAGGLFVPQSIPSIEKGFLSEISGMDYRQLSLEIFKLFLTDYTSEEIKECIDAAYNIENFDHPDIAPLVKNGDVHILELWHGPTAAFKDMALQILPHLLVKAMKKTDTKKEVVILVATSGDTGKAALEGFKNVPGTKVICFFPYRAVSKIQELQMTTTDGDNTYVVAVKGNFDDCQTAVKNIFRNSDFIEATSQSGYELSSANSINWGRLLPQIVYYFWAYAQLLKNKEIEAGDTINAVVPTGNFGNILAAYFALKMGLPINKLICASNSNNVLTDFLATGVYNKNRDFHQTMSPSMDILISSNLERFLFDILGNDATKVAHMYEELDLHGEYKISEATLQQMKDIMEGGCADENDTLNAIKNVFESSGYVLDPHTAVGYHVWQQYRNRTKDNTPTILTATANPYKFNASVLKAISNGKTYVDEFAMVEELHHLTKLPVHRALDNLQNKAVLHVEVTIPQSLQDVVENILKI